MTADWLIAIMWYVPTKAERIYTYSTSKPVEFAGNLEMNLSGMPANS